MYNDSDGDFYGGNISLSTCYPPLGYVDNSDDCNDNDPDINPDAFEVCDSIDNDCDGIIDGPDSIDAYLGYTDLDGDGYGTGQSFFSCGPLAEFDGDCDDNDPDINPDAAEDLDALDNNCDGNIDEGESFGVFCDQENYNGSSYQFCYYILSYDDIIISGVASTCDSYGYHPVIIDDEFENAFVGNTANYGDWWIGLVKDGGTWQWIDGSPVLYENYTNPFGNNGSCGYLRSSNLKWYSGLCITPRYFVCEANSQP